MAKKKISKSWVRKELFMRKIYTLLREKPQIFKVKKLKGYVAGHCFTKERNGFDRIEIHPKHEVISVLIHEVLHYCYPEWDEDVVLWHEAYFIKVLSARQLTNILKKFASTL